MNCSNRFLSIKYVLKRKEIEKENQRLSDLYCTDANLVMINGEEVQVTHYVMEELCRLAGIKYIDYEDYEINITMKE